MKTRRIFKLKSGFTLVELLVSMAITLIIVTVLVSVTSMAMDTWNRSRSELRAARQAKAMVDTMARDFEGLVTRSGNTYEWLSATSSPIAEGNNSNASELIFFSAATDRYNGQIGVDGTDKGGDVSCVAYRLKYKNPIKESSSTYQTFVLNRLLLNPDTTFTDLLGKADLAAAFLPHSSKLDEVENFVCENVFQFTVTFQIEVTKDVSSDPTKPNIRKFTIPESIIKGGGAENSVESFRVLGSGIVANVSGTTIDSVSISDAEIKSGSITAVGISLTVLTDGAIEQLRKNSALANKADWLAKNSYQYSKLIQLPGM